jgi:hypothetical protein
MKNRRINISRFLIITALALIGCYAGLTAGRNAGAEAPKDVATPLPALRGEAAFRHLEQTGLHNSLWAAVTAARFGVEERKGGGYQASNPKQNYRRLSPHARAISGRDGSRGNLLPPGPAPAPDPQ